MTRPAAPLTLRPMLLADTLGLPFGGDLAMILLVAIALDAILGDPPWLYRAVPHPVALLGRAIGWAEGRFNREGGRRSERLQRGLLVALGIAGGAFGLGWALSWILGGIGGGWLLEAILASTLIAYRSLFDHARAVAVALAGSLAEGRAAVAHIVGRDPESLDEAGVSRAAVESLAENFSDGVVAPAFWYLLLGLPGLCAYKAINTLDSMIGHRTPRHDSFGKASARIDDTANWIPARLSGLILVLAAVFQKDADAGRAWRTLVRDAPKHRSPNAGWQEAAVAGALGFALAGPRRYGGQRVEDAWMGDGRSNLTAQDINAALALYLRAGAVLAVMVLMTAV